MSRLTKLIESYAAGEQTLDELTEAIVAFDFRTPARLDYTRHQSGYEAEAHAEATAFDEEADTWDEVRTARYLRGQLTGEEYLHLVRAVRPGDGGAKFSPDQERDDHGRWTSDGGTTITIPSFDDLAAGEHGEQWRETTEAIAEQGMGNCYDAAVTIAMNATELGLEDVRIVQATVMGRGQLEGTRFGHSWAESGGLAYDWSSGNRVVMPDVVYRALGQAEDVHEYTTDEAITEMVRTGHYGPWATETPLAGSSEWGSSGPVG